MTNEPVAYLNKYLDNSTNITRYKPENQRLLSSTPLYKSEQLQNKIELTKDEFELLSKVNRGIQPFQKIEQHIKVLPDMKWFVRSKKQYQPDMDQGISESGYLYLKYGDIYSVEYHEMTTFKDEAEQFNTEDEAKLWTTPDTKAVFLPVEGGE